MEYLNDTLICDHDLSLTIEVFSKKNTKMFYNFNKHLKNSNTCTKLAEAAFDKRVLSKDQLNRVRHSKDPMTFLHELMSKNCTMKILCHIMLGNGLEALFSLLEIQVKMFVIKQPCYGPATVGRDIVLEFLVEGTPIIRYQWYFNDTVMEGQVKSSLQIYDLSLEDEGVYYCLAEQVGKGFTHSLKSNLIYVNVLVKPPNFVVNLPPELICEGGDDLCLYVEPDDDFIGTYEWVKGDQIITSPLANRKKLKIKNAQKEDEGKYKCILRNSAGEKWSDVCYLHVTVPIEPSYKLALIVGNYDYDNFSNLSAPRYDVRLLTECLRQIGFTTFNLLNLNLKEFYVKVCKFINLIRPESFILFFYSGHGFEIANNKFFLPVDCPPCGQYNLKDCVSLQYITGKIIDKKPFLLVNILDMCLKCPDKEDNDELYHSNIPNYEYDITNVCYIEACATSDYQFAYERKKDIDGGLYTKILCKYLKITNLNIDTVIQRAHEEFGETNKEEQSPQIKKNYHKEEFKLCTPAKYNYNPEAT